MSSSVLFEPELHNNLEHYQTVTHKKNVLIINKGFAFKNSLKVQTLDYISCNILQKSKRNRAASFCKLTQINRLGKSTKLMTKLEELKGDTSIEETKILDNNFNEMLKDMPEDYLDRRLSNEEIKNSYRNCSKNWIKYRETQAYLQAKCKYLTEEKQFKKDLVNYEGNIALNYIGRKTVIIGLDGVLANFSLEVIKNYEIGRASCRERVYVLV